MHKFLLSLAVLITAYTVAIAKQPKPQVQPAQQAELVVVQSDTLITETLDSTRIDLYLEKVKFWKANCGASGLALIQEGKTIGVSVVDEFKGLPLPTTQEGIKAWTDKVGVLFGSFGSVIVMILTFLFSLAKKDPEGAINKVNEIFNKIRTRYLLFISSAVVTIIGAVLFSEGGFSAVNLLKSILAFVGVTIGSMGLQNFLEMLGIKWFKAKKVAIPAA